MKPVVLFVDDEPNILRGLKRSLRGKRDKWEMVFIEGGQAAVEWLGMHDVDVIVTDMRMPRCDGADVLEFATQRSKGLVRLVLSGEADLDLTFRTVGYSHQFLSKPCEEIRLVRAIEAPLSLVNALEDKEKRAIADSCSKPFCSRATHRALSAALSKGGLEDVVAVAASDPGLALRIFQLANSAYFGRPADTLSVAEACATVGVDVLKALHQQGRLISEPLTEDVDDALARIAECAEAASRELTSVAIAHYGASEREAEAAFAAGLVSWVGEALTSSGGFNAALRGAPPMAAASFAASLLGLPLQLCAAVQALQETESAVEDPLLRARELASALFEKAAA